MVRGLFKSRGGRLGLIIFAGAIGAYYGVTALTNVTHPDYFVSSALAFQVIGLGGTFHALFPGFTLVSIAAVYVLVLLVIALLLFYAIALEYRPTWLTTPLILLMANTATVLITPVVGWVLRIVTDYARFGFFLIIPTALSLGYLIDRGWISSRRGVTPPNSDASPKTAEPLHRRWLRESRHPRRAVTLAVVAIILGILVAATITAPSVGRLEVGYTKVGHDQEFLDALHAIEQTGTPGNILTVQGADKWARALTDRNAYAPYAQASLLFYQTQILDSELSYYALSSHFAVTNGLVSAEIRGTAGSNLNGIPNYGIYYLGTFHPVLSIDPSLVEIDLIGSSNHTAYEVNLTGTPTVTLPPSTGGGPLEVTYTTSRFVFSTYIEVVPAQAQVDVTFSVDSTTSDLVRSLNVTIVPPATASATVWPANNPGEFNWIVHTRGLGPLTLGNVTPASALKGITSSLSSPPAVLLSFNSSSQLGTQALPGLLSLVTPTASALFKVLPPVVVTTQIWSELGIRFILMTNSSYDPAVVTAFPGEIAYLQSEYGLPIIFENAEWAVLEVPSA